MNKFASGTFFVCVYVFFLNKRYIFSYTFALCGQVGDKKISPGRFRKQNYFFGLILNTKCKNCESRKKLCKKNFTYTKKFYVH